MLNWRFIEQIHSYGHRRSLMMAGAFRVAMLLFVWLMIAVPRNPSWNVGNAWTTHLFFALFTLNASLGLWNYYRWRFVVFSTFYITFIDLLGIAALIFYTGGLASPFVYLFLLEIIGTLILGGFWQGMILTLFGLVLLGLGHAVVLMDWVKLPDPFSQPYLSGENYVKITADYIMLFLFIAFTALLNAFVSRKVDKLHEQLEENGRALDAANIELMESFQDLEAMSDRVKGQDIQWEAAQNILTGAERLIFHGRLSAGILDQVNNPLTAIITDIEMIMINQRDSLTPAMREALEKILDATNKLQRLVRQLSTLSIAKGRTLFEMLDMNELAERAVELATLDTKRKDVNIILEQSKSTVKVPGNETEIEQMLLSLLLNSVLSIPGDKGRVVVTLDQSGDQFVISVSDNGRGIPSWELDKIFDPFYRSRGGLQGIGLGLFMVKQIVENHGGKMYVSSELGRGTVFTIYLPLADTDTKSAAN